MRKGSYHPTIFSYFFILSLCHKTTPHAPLIAIPKTPYPLHSQMMTILLISMMPSKHLILCHPLLLLPSVFPRIKVFLNESVLPIRWPKYWTFSCSISASNEYLGLNSFTIDWLDLHAVQQTLEFSPTPQFKSMDSSTLSCLYSTTLTSIHGY